MFISRLVSLLLPQKRERPDDAHFFVCVSFCFYSAIAELLIIIMERDPLPYCTKVEEYWLTKDHRMLRTL